MRRPVKLMPEAKKPKELTPVMKAPTNSLTLEEASQAFEDVIALTEIKVEA